MDQRFLEAVITRDSVITAKCRLSRNFCCPAMLRCEMQPVGVDGQRSTEQTHSGADPEHTHNQWNPEVKALLLPLRSICGASEGFRIFKHF